MASKLNDINVLEFNLGITRPTAAVSTAITAAGVDMIAYDNNCFAIQNIGTVAGTETVLTAKLQEAANITSGYTDIAGATFTGITSTTGVPGISLVNFQRTQRYVRYMMTITGTTASVALDVLIGGQKKQVT